MNEETLTNIPGMEPTEEVIIKKLGYGSLNILRSNGVKDLFIDIDFNGSLEQVNLIPALRQLKILKQLHIPISARIPSTRYFDQQVGMELLMETLLDLGCILIRADHCNKITQILKQWENRIRIENEYSRK
jgi:hypothetical protein